MSASATSRTNVWKRSTSGDWNNYLNWTYGVPLPIDNVVIAPLSPLVVSMPGSSAVTVAGFVLKGATLSNSNLVVTGAATFSNAALQGGYGVRLTGSGTVSSLSIAGLTRFNADGATVTQSGGNVNLFSGLNGPTAITLTHGGVWNIADASGIISDPLWVNTPYRNAVTIGLSGSGTGLLEKTGTGVSVISANLFNNSANTGSGSTFKYAGLEVTNGILDVKGDVSGYVMGSDNIVGAGKLQFDGSVLNQNVSFFGSGGVLSLTAPGQFHGVISGFDKTGSNDLMLLSGNLQFRGAAEGSTQTHLVFSGSNSSFAELVLLGDYRGQTFHAQSVGNGVLAITI